MVLECLACWLCFVGHGCWPYWRSKISDSF